MKQIKKFVPVLLAVIVLAAVSVVPVLAQEPTPPVVESVEVAPPAFDWAKISNALTDLLTAFLIPSAAFAARWLFAKGSVEYSKLTEAQREMFKSYLKTAIYAAEQMDLKGKVRNKFDYVVELAEIWLAQNRLVIGLDEVKAEIEAIVAREFNMGKILAPKADTPRING